MKFTVLRDRLAFFCVAGVLILCTSSTVPAEDQLSPVRIYRAAPGEPLSSQFIVKVNDETVPVYLATVVAMSTESRRRANFQHFVAGDLGQTSLASFDLRGEAHVNITCPTSIQSIKLLPSSSGIIPQVSGNMATFTVSKTGPFVLEVNGDTVQCLQLFANPWDDDAPSEKDPNVIYFGPGVHRIPSLKVTSGKTVYIAADAVVYGTTDGPPGPMIDLHGDNITLRGRGILDGSLCPGHTRSILGEEGKNISVEGVILRDASSWTMPITGSDQVKVRNVKIFGFRGNSDGIDINGSRNVDISDCYIRTNDDLIVVKTQIPKNGPSQHVTAEHCVLWNELAHALSLGAELRAGVDDIHFSDCDIIHDMGREWLLRVYDCDSADPNNVTFDNIRIEECQRLMSLWIGKAIWSKDADAGHIDNITFRNITSPAPLRPSSRAELVGVDAAHAIHGVKIDHVVIGGKPFAASDVKQNPFVDGVEIVP